MSRFFFNERKHLVDDALEGLVLSAPHANLVRLDIDPAIRIVARSDWDKSRVAIISGGGSGHEPAHAGFVGRGMLTAAVCGDLFASPSVDAVLNAIVAVTGDRGCLLIVKNYTGDRLNFGLAAEKAKRYGLKVEMVIVSDDVALPDNKQPRGIAGTAMVHKVAGHAAEQGKSLSEVLEIARQASRGVFSLGLAMETCNLPGGETEDRIKPGLVELGLGIHGEPGASTVNSHNSKQLIGALVETLRASAGDNRVAVLINNLGGVSELEMALLTKELAHSSLREQIAYLIGPATLVSSLDMKGFSLSLIVLNQVIEQALLADVETTGWVKAVAFAPLRTLTHAKVHDALEVLPSENPQVHALVAQATQTLQGLESRLNALDAKVGDGDTGSTFALGAQDIATQLEQNVLPLNNPAQLLQLIGERLATVMGGSSGVLMSLFFTAAGQALAQRETLPNALLAGLKQMKFYGGAAPGDRTLIDALQPALEALRDKGLTEAIAAAQQGAESTATMQKAKAGRASYVNSDNLNGVPDPGAVAVAEVFAAFAKA
ncbi:TPA: dihydroxyacetone kinase subunit DhaK [Kluyvera georgiana]|uniref:ATP-dependent dihydroxyacetone kinase n=1 Tax=Kluyvera georgiana ATCC 51603 TaxID=1354264 RepID=A0A1B7JQC7_9ENTR|nr:dihydroxyacetone kinase subunit DhaK [Kluyvera georgiana]OAT50113.1 ATP-dependent dihydroxyacetone kinase [Kluyvera georgiana ATCC 51603]